LRGEYIISADGGVLIIATGVALVETIAGLSAAAKGAKGYVKNTAHGKSIRKDL
jgi:hypothetical protein